MRQQFCKSFLARAATLAIFAGCALAANHHELNGTWQLVPARSEFHGEPVMRSGVITIDDFVAYREHHNFIFRPTRALWPAASVDADLPKIQLPSGKKTSASRWLDTIKRFNS